MKESRLTRLSRISPGKWITATATTGAAIVSILSFARSYGVIGDEPSVVGVGTLGVAWVGLSPAAVTAPSIGDTLHLAATITNKNGSVVVGSWLEWVSDDTTIATVGEDGTVIARAPGATNIVLVVGQHVARSRVTVKQQPAGIRFVPDSVIVIPENGSLQVRPQVTDARGHPIHGIQAALRVSDTSIAKADSTGIIMAIVPGRTSIEATIDTLSARSELRVDPVPTTLAIVTGADQHALAGRQLPTPITVRVLSLRNKPIPGIPVHFATGDGQGHPNPSSVVTDSAGRARTVWTLAEVPGRQRLVARVDHLDSLATIIAEADPVAANLRHTMIGDAQVAGVGDSLPERIGLRITDSTGRPLADIPVTWSAPAGDSIVADAARTDSTGEVRARWRLGSKAGLHRARVQIGGTRAIPAYPITAMGRPAEPHAVTVKGGPGQTAAVGTALPQPIVVRVADRFDNPVAGVTVIFEPGAGSVSDSIAATDSAGRATIRWTLGAAVGAQKLVARVADIGKPAEVLATATVGKVAKAAFGAPPAGPSVSRALAPQPAVTITDAMGNPIAGATVVFATTTGTVSPATVKTDAKGRAATKWTLGAKAGVQRLSATVRGTTIRATLEVKAAAPATTAAPRKKSGQP